MSTLFGCFEWRLAVLHIILSFKHLWTNFFWQTERATRKKKSTTEMLIRYKVTSFIFVSWAKLLDVAKS